MAADTGSVFFDQLERIKLISGKNTQAELAKFLGVRPASISEAKRRGRIPSKWLLVLMQDKKISPEWVLTGNGPCQVISAEYGDGAARLPTADEEALRRLPARMLTDELLRRLAAVPEREIAYKP